MEAEFAVILLGGIYLKILQLELGKFLKLL